MPREDPAIQKPTTEPSPPRDTYHAWNLALFCLLLLLLSVWFALHIGPAAAQTTVFGAFTLVTLWKVIQNAIKTATEKEPVAYLRGLLGRRGAREALVVGLLGSTLLLASTASIHVTHEGASPGESLFHLTVSHDGNPFLAPFDIRSEAGSRVRVFFPVWRTRDLEIAIVEPPGFRPEHRRFSALLPLRLKVPADFDRKRLHILRIVPIVRLYERLRPVSGEAPVRHALRLFHAGRTYQLPDLRRQIVYAGADSTTLRWELDRDTRREQEILTGLSQVQLAEEAKRRRLHSLEGSLVVLDTPDFTSGERVRLIVLRIDEDGIETVVDSATAVIQPAGKGKNAVIQTVLL